MIRNLTIVAVASFVLAVGCFAGAAALGGPELLKHGWNFPADWNIEIHDDHDGVHVNRRSDDGDHGETVTRDVAWSGADALQIDVPAEVIFTQAAAGAGASVKVTGPKDLVDRVTMENGRLGLRDGEGEGDIVFHARRD